MSYDHKRGCQGREYTCTCGYDAKEQASADRLFALLTEARDEIEASADTAREFDLIARIDDALDAAGQ